MHETTARILVLATILCTLYVLNYAYGWITPEDLMFFGPEPN